MNLDRVMNKEFAALEQQITPRDCMLYALGIGLGTDPLDSRELQYTYEPGLRVFPAMANVIAHPGRWVSEPSLEIDWVRLLHGEQSFVQLQPLQPGATYVGRYRVKGVVDKGKMALLLAEKELIDKGTGAAVCTVNSTYVLRGDGGCGSTMPDPPKPPPLPGRAPDFTTIVATLPQIALLYRLSGDYNPIHADPVAAQKAGFQRPILHGLCTLAIATRALINTHADADADRLRALSLRFSSPVYPGETISVESWREGDRVAFRARVIERDVLVLDAGSAEFGI
jgi:acyl dehydratase